MLTYSWHIFIGFYTACEMSDTFDDPSDHNNWCEELRRLLVELDCGTVTACLSHSKHIDVSKLHRKVGVCEPHSYTWC